MKRFTFLSLSIASLATSVEAQTNEGGTLQVGLGVSLGVHSAVYEEQYTALGTVQNRDYTDGVITRTFPIDVQIGIAKPISIGLYGEFGSYLDSNDTRSNRLLLLGLAPRVYIINKDQFNWFAGPEVGISGLQIEEVPFAGKSFTDSYAGIHVRVATGVSYYFGDHFGLQAQIKYAMHSMQWRDRDPENTAFDAMDYEGTLTTSGIQFGLGAAVKF